MNFRLFIIIIFIFFTSHSYAKIDPYWRSHGKYDAVFNQLRRSFKKIDTSNIKDGKLKNDLRDFNELLGNRHELTPRDAYKKIIKKYRSLINSDTIQAVIDYPKGSNIFIAKVYDDLVRFGGVLYTGVNIQKYNNSLVDNLIKENEKLQLKYSNVNEKDLSFLPLMKRKILKLKEDYSSIRNAPEKLKINRFEKLGQNLKSSISAANFDPNMQGSLVSVKMKLIPKDKSKIKEQVVIRMATPTIGSREGKVKINPEFRMYLESLKQKNTKIINAGKDPKYKHYYFNYQDMRKVKNKKMQTLFAKLGINNEKNRGDAISELAGKNSKYKDVFEVISLNKNSDFYFQKGKFKKKSYTVKDFKERLLEELVGSDRRKTGVFVPRDLESKGMYKRIIYSLTRNVLKKEEDEEISPHERRSLIELAYMLITMNLSKDASSVNHTCKDGIDRGGGANALLHTLMAVSQYCEKSPGAGVSQSIDSLRGMIFSDALQSRKRPIIKERMDIYIEASSYLLDANCDGVKELGNLIPYRGVLLNLERKQVANLDVNNNCSPVDSFYSRPLRSPRLLNKFNNFAKRITNFINKN